ncbi:hypothetical protein DL96DRAFT_1709934 [Flagelloscypha sp. PMI_526]|nr:hypothetical protein DL96DRAFT_1709934 [Flagelloscypha sp. PMI_526]
MSGEAFGVDTQAVEDAELALMPPPAAPCLTLLVRSMGSVFEEDDSFGDLDALSTFFSSASSSPRDAPCLVLSLMLRRWMAGECGWSWGYLQFLSSERRKK